MLSSWLCLSKITSTKNVVVVVLDVIARVVLVQNLVVHVEIRRRVGMVWLPGVLVASFVLSFLCLVA